MSNNNNREQSDEPTDYEQPGWVCMDPLCGWAYANVYPSCGIDEYEYYKEYVGQPIFSSEEEWISHRNQRHLCEQCRVYRARHLLSGCHESWQKPNSEECRASLCQQCYQAWAPDHLYKLHCKSTEDAKKQHPTIPATGRCMGDRV